MLQDNRRTRTWLTRSDCHCRWIKAFLLQENTSLCTEGMIMESVLHECATAGSLSDFSAAHAESKHTQPLMFVWFKVYSLLDMHLFFNKLHTIFPIFGTLFRLPSKLRMSVQYPSEVFH